MTKKKRGRPPIDPALKKEKITIRLEHWLITWLDEQDATRGDLIHKAIMRFYKLRNTRKLNIQNEDK